MEFKIVEKKEKPMLDRLELKADLVFAGAVPSREEVRKKVASSEGVSDNLVVIKNIKSAIGYGKAQILAYVYKDEASLKKIEYEYMVNRGKPKKEGENKDAPKDAKK